MTDRRFVTLSPALSARLSRRAVLRGTAAGSAGLAAIPGFAIAAQDATPDSCPEVAPEGLIATASRFFTEGLAEGDLDVIDAIYATDSVHDGAFFPVLPDHQAIKDLLANIRTAFPDLTVAIDEGFPAFTDGEFVVMHWTCSGTFTAPVQGFEPTGDYVTWSGINMFQFACGKIVESWSEGDNLTQLGLARDSGSEIVATPAAVATPVATCEETSAAANIKLAEQWLSAFTHGEGDLLATLVTPNTRHHFGLRRDTIGVEPLLDGVEIFRIGFPNLDTVVEQAIAHDTFVALRYSVSGTLDGPFLGIEPTGVAATWSGINVFRIECGLVAESWSEVAGLNLWRQIGLVPPAATPNP